MSRKRLLLRPEVLLLALCVLGGCRHGVDGGVPASSGARVHFEPGLWDFSVGGSSSLHRIENDQVDRAYTAMATPSVGYFLTDRLEAMASAAVAIQDVRYEESDEPLALKRSKMMTYGAGLGLQYNFDGDGQVVPFLRVIGGAVHSDRELRQVNAPLAGTVHLEDDTVAPFAATRVGIRYFLTDRITSDVAVGWRRTWYEESFGDTTDDISLNVGLSLLF